MMMNKLSPLLFAASLVGVCSAPGAPAFRQCYPVDAALAAKNRQRLAADLTQAPEAWKQAPVSYYVVAPLSDIPRTPERYPADGVAFGPLEIIAAQGEFEPASLVFASRQPIDRFLLRAGDLQGPSGAKIPAADIDIKVIKVWYQSGAAWYGYFADALGRRLVPEMLLNDENLVRVDGNTRDNYVRYSNKDGSTHDQWMTANFMVVNDAFANQANQGLIQDARTLQPVVLNPDEFKQFFVTVRVPTNAAPGLYTGCIDLLTDGRDAGAIPLRLRVLPFTLPDPKTNYDPEKTFYLCLYGTDTSNPKVLRNLAEHNVRHTMGFPAVNTMNPARFTDDIRLAREAGLSTRPLFRSTASVGITADPDQPSGEERRRLDVLRREIAETAELTSRHLGHADFYSYGVDEGGPSVIRREQAAWRTAHEAGGKVMVSSYPWRRLLFALDFMIMPGMPVEKRAGEVRKFHEANPDALCGWYANPHSGPENPNYFRRIHGLQAYKMNYDVSANYCWWRNNWNDMATPYENTLRNIVMVLGTADDVIDTLAWEGVREGLDDIRYATALRDRAREALKHPDGGRRLLGRRALGFLAYWDEQRDDLDAFRSETIRYILELDEAPKGGRP
jgi:hypothetical protein